MPFQKDDPREEWRPVVGWAGFYDVSNLGRVRRRKQIGRVGDKGGPLKLGTCYKGYKTACLSDKLSGRRKIYFVHVLVCSAFWGEKPSPIHQVAHEDGSKTNNYFLNLRWKTAKENQADRVRHGTNLIGELMPTSKLTEVDIVNIKELASLGFFQKDMAFLWGVCQPTISKILSGRRWSYLS